MKGVKSFLWASLCLSLACTPEEDALRTIPAEPADCLVKSSANAGAIIVGSYIVVMKANTLRSSSAATVEAQAESLMRRYSQTEEEEIEHSFQGQAVSGFVADLSEATVQRLRQDPAVELIEPDRILGLCACVQLVNARQVVWNVRKTGYGNGQNFSRKTVWIIDSGVDIDHPDLNIDQERSLSFVPDESSVDDVNGHGTHVAGIIGALNNNVGVLGVASGAHIVALKVLNKEGEGRTSDIIRAVAHVGLNGRAGDVVNLSLGGEGGSTVLEREIRAAADKGILFAIAAGNEGDDASKYSPARVNHSNVFTVSAVDSTDTFAAFSNYNSTVVDVAAYGVRITSTWLNGRYAIASGTSAAAPHVAALLLIRGRNIPTRGLAKNDPDGMADPIARE
jgi:subtilisin family serine protease